MTSETDTPQTLIVQARDEEIEKTTIICTDNHPKEHTSFQDEVVEDDSERKNNLKVREGSNEYIDAQRIVYPTTVEKIAYEDTVSKAEDCLEGISDETKASNVNQNNQKLDNEEVATADEQLIERPCLDVISTATLESSDSVISSNHKIISEQNNTEEVRDSRGKSETEAHVELLDQFSSHEKKMEEIPVRAFDQQLLRSDQIDEKSENKACCPEKCIGETNFNNPAAATGIYKVDVSEVNISDKGPEIIRQTEKQKTHKDVEEKMKPSGLEEINLSQTSSSPIDSDKKSMSGTMKDECINLIEDNEEKKSKSLCEKDLEGMIRSRETIMTKTEDESFDSNFQIQEEETDKNKGERSEGSDILSKINSEITVKGPLSTPVEKPEECIVKETLMPEESDKRNLDEASMSISETTRAVEPIKEILFPKPGDTKVGMADPDYQHRTKDTFGVGNCDKAKSPQDITTEAKEKRDEKQDVCPEFQPKEREEQKFEDPSEENLHNEQASKVRIYTEVPSTEKNSNGYTKTKPDEECEVVSDFTSIAQEETVSEFEEPLPQNGQEMQSADKLAEIETERNASDTNLHDNSIANLTESVEKDSVNSKVHPQEESVDDYTVEERSDSKQDIEKINEVAKEVSYNNIPEECNVEPHTLPKHQLDISFPDESVIRNETIFTTISREENTLLWKDQNKNSNDDSNVVCISKGNDNSDAMELDNESDISESISIEVPKDGNKYQGHRSSETNGTDIVEDIIKVNNQVEERNNYHEDQNQIICTCMDFEAQKPQIDAKDDLSHISNDSIELAETKEATSEVVHNKENKDAKDTKGTASSEENVEPTDAVEKLGDTKPDAANENSVSSAEASQDDSGESRRDTQEILCNEHNEKQALCNTTTEILKAEKSIRNLENANKGFENTNLDPPQLHGTNSLVIQVEAHERCGSIDVQEVKELENTGFEKSSRDKEEGIQESIENSQIQNELSKASNNDSLQATDAKGTTDTQHEPTEDGKLCNIVNDISGEQDTNTKSNCIEEQMGENTHGQTDSIEIQETEAVNNEEMENKHSKENATNTVIQGQNIAEESVPIIEDRNPVLSKECTYEVDKEETNEKMQCRVESGCQSTITDGVPSYQIREGGLVEEKQSFEITVEDMDKVMNDESESTDALHDEIIHEKVAIIEIYNEVENRVPNKDKLGRSSSAEFPFNEIKEETSVEGQQCCADVNVTVNDFSLHKQSGFEIEQKNDNYINISMVKDEEQTSPSQDMAESQIIEVQTEEKTIEETVSTDIHEAKMATHEDTMIQSSEASHSCSGKQDEEILEASMHLLVAKDIATGNDVGTRIPVEKIHVGKVKKEISIDKIQCKSETENQNTNVCSHELTTVANVPDYENSTGSIENDMKAQSSDNEEEPQDEKINEQIVLNDSYELHVVNNEVIENQSSKKSVSCGTQNQEIAQESKLFTESENPIPSTHRCTQESDENIQASEVEHVAVTEKQESRAQKVDLNAQKINFSPQENDNSMNTLDEANQAITVESDTKVQLIQEIHEQTQKTEEISKEEIMNKKTDQSNSCCEKQDLEISGAFFPPMEAQHFEHLIDSGLSISTGQIQVIKAAEVAVMYEQKTTLDYDADETSKGAISHGVKGVENFRDLEDSEDIYAALKTIEVPKEERIYEQTYPNEIHERTVVNNEMTVNQSSKESSPCSLKQDQGIAQASILPLVEVVSHASCKDECSRISNEAIHDIDFEEEEAIGKQNCISETEYSKTLNSSASSSAARNENSTKIVGDQNQELHADSYGMEVQEEEDTQRLNGSIQIDDKEVVKHENIVNQSFKVSNCTEGSTQCIEAETLVPNKEERPCISSEEIQLSEVENKEKIKKQQCSKEVENKTTDSVSSFEVTGEEIEPENEITLQIVVEVEKDINDEIGIIKVHSGCTEIHDTKADNSEVIQSQISEESGIYSGKQDQSIAEASTQLLQVESPVQSKTVCDKIYNIKIQVSETEEERITEDPNKTPDGVSLSHVKEAEVVLGNEDSINTVEDVDEEFQDINTQSNIINLQKGEKTHQQIESNEINKTQEVTMEESGNSCSEEDDFCSGKQDADIGEASILITEAENSIQVIDESSTACTKQFHFSVGQQPEIDSSETRNGVFSYHNNIMGVENEPEKDNSTKTMEAEDQDIHTQSNTIELQKDETTYKQTTSDGIYGTHEINNTEINIQCSNEEAGDPNIKIEGVELELENENENSNSVKDVHQVTNAQSGSIEEQNDDKTHEQAEYIGIKETENINHEEISTQRSEERKSCIGKQDTEIAQPSKPIIEVENFVPSNEKSNRISYEDIQISEVKGEPAIEKQQRCPMDPTMITNNVSSYKNIQPAALKEMDICCTESIELEDANDAMSRNKDHNAIIGKHSRDTEKEEITPEEVVVETAEDADQLQDGRDVYDMRNLEGNETTKSSKSREINGSISLESEATQQEIQVDKPKYKMPHQQTPTGTEASGQNAGTEKDNLERSQLAKVSNDNTKAGIKGESHKRNNDDPMDMNDGLEEEVKQGNIPISKDETYTISEMVKDEELLTSIEGEITSVQHVKALEVSSSEEPEHASNRKEFPQKDKNLNILAAMDVGMSQLTGIDHDSKVIPTTKLYPKQSIEVTRFGDFEQEVNFPKATGSYVNCQDVERKTVDETEPREIWQANEPQDQLKELSSGHHKQKNVVTEIEAGYESSKTTKVLKEEKSDECSSETSQEIYLSIEEQRELEVSNSGFIPSIDLQENQVVEDVTKRCKSSMPELGDLSSKKQSNLYPSEILQNKEANIYKGGSSQETRKVEESSEQTNDTIQHDSPSEVMSGNTIISSIDADIQGQPENLEDTIERNDQRIHSEDGDIMEGNQCTVRLIMEGNQSKNLEECKLALCDTANTKVLSSDPALEKQNMQKIKPINKQEMVIMGEAQETNTKCSMSSVDGVEAKATRQVPLEHKDYEEFCQIEGMKELDNALAQSTVAEKEQEMFGNHPASTSFHNPCDDVSKVKGIEELAKEMVGIGKNSKERPEEHNKNDANAQDETFVKESKRNGVTSLPPKDIVNESLEKAKTDDSNIVNDDNREHQDLERTDEDNNETPADSNTIEQRNLKVGDATIEQEHAILHKEIKDKGKTIVVKSISDEEKEDEQEDLDLKVPLTSETSRDDIELKASHKKSHNILLGVGSKVKNSISKVKKAMTCTSSQFAPEDVLIKLNKNKKSLDKP